MSPEQQRIAIAEACGIIVAQDQWGPLYHTPNGIVRDCPDYLNDLNACAEMEKVMTDAEWRHYNNVTYDIACEMHEKTGKWLWGSLPAPQRCEAFLIVKGRWTGGKE